jgi:hypothetical protein
MKSGIKNIIVDSFVGKPPNDLNKIQKNSEDCHNKYVKGQKNKNGHPISSIYSDHPNWNSYKNCMDKTKKEQDIMSDFNEKRTRVRKILFYAGLVAVVYGIYWVGTKNKIK